MIKAKDVSLVYNNGTIALEDVDLNIGKGEIVYITGPSGSGKTSLLKLIIGIEKPFYGDFSVLGQDMVRPSSREIRKLRRKIGPIFQEFKLIRGRTALENVMMGMRVLGFPNRIIREESEKYLHKVGLGHKTGILVENLSWGEGQRVAIARALARQPELILADEPTGNLDKENALNILELLINSKHEDTTVLITTHATHLIEDRTDGLFINVNKGKIKINKVEAI